CLYRSHEGGLVAVALAYLPAPARRRNGTNAEVNPLGRGPVAVARRRAPAGPRCRSPAQPSYHRSWRRAILRAEQAISGTHCPTPREISAECERHRIAIG